MTLNKKCDYCGREITNKDGTSIGFSQWCVFHFKKRRDFCCDGCFVRYVQERFKKFLLTPDMFKELLEDINMNKFIVVELDTEKRITITDVNHIDIPLKQRFRTDLFLQSLIEEDGQDDIVDETITEDIKDNEDKEFKEECVDCTFCKHFSSGIDKEDLCSLNSGCVTTIPERRTCSNFERPNLNYMEKSRE